VFKHGKNQPVEVRTGVSVINPESVSVEEKDQMGAEVYTWEGRNEVSYAGFKISLHSGFSMVYF
jgi:hypothetical protein